MATRNGRCISQAKSCANGDRITLAQFVVTASVLADFMKSVEQEETILIQRLSDLEARSLQAEPQFLATALALLDAPEVLDPAPLSPPLSVFVTYGEM